MANGTRPNFAKGQEANGADAYRIRWRRIVNVNETIEICAGVSRPQIHFKLAMAPRRAAFSGNTSSHFLVLHTLTSTKHNKLSFFVILVIFDLFSVFGFCAITVSTLSPTKKLASRDSLCYWYT